MTAGGSKLASKIRYRFPEKVIRTDFWSKVRADESSKIGDVFYIAAEEIAHRAPMRLVALEDGVVPDDSRYRPFGNRDHPLSGLDALADIASSRLKDGLVPPSFAQPSRTRQLIHTALGIELSNDEIPESSLRASLSELEEACPSSSDSPLSSLSESETGETAVPDEPIAHVSEEELVKRIALEAATRVSSGDTVRLSKRKAAVAAESAITGHPSTPAKKLRSDSPAITPVANRREDRTRADRSPTRRRCEEDHAQTKRPVGKSGSSENGVPFSRPVRGGEEGGRAATCHPRVDAVEGSGPVVGVFTVAERGVR